MQYDTVSERSGTAAARTQRQRADFVAPFRSVPTGGVMSGVSGASVMLLHVQHSFDGETSGCRLRTLTAHSSGAAGGQPAVRRRALSSLHARHAVRVALTDTLCVLLLLLLQDKSGQISTKEFGKLCFGLGYALTDAELDLAVKLLDKDASGHIELGEFKDWWRRDDRWQSIQLEGFELQKRQDAADSFNAFDADQSGSIDQADFPAFYASCLEKKLTNHSQEKFLENLDVRTNRGSAGRWLGADGLSFPAATRCPSFSLLCSSLSSVSANCPPDLWRSQDSVP